MWLMYLIECAILTELHFVETRRCVCILRHAGASSLYEGRLLAQPSIAGTAFNEY